MIRGATHQAPSRHRIVLTGLLDFVHHALIKRGATVNRARKTALFVASLGVLPILFADKITGLWTAVLMLGLVTAAHQAFSSNLYTLVSDMFPRRAVATIAGFFSDSIVASNCCAASSR